LLSYSTPNISTELGQRQERFSYIKGKPDIHVFVPLSDDSKYTRRAARLQEPLREQSMGPVSVADVLEAPL
jgi:hypothetical protein